MTFYDCTGRAVAYTDDNEGIYLYSGTPVAYLYDSIVYSYRGTQLGRFERGWVRDKNGYCVFFTDNTRGSGPAKPIKKIKPAKGVKQIKPVKCVRHVPYAKAIDSLNWSPLSGERFFMQ
ncbi:hypothetical protein SAMN04487831_11251 [Pseudobutyrivibrio sp. UC1225]|uniref:4-fold beta flower protein n=1 Tax=Pseudobutyrivibrio sp. UC1225 TaxID=1798185 RepID=UPI0008EBF3BC|nr:hypothetical protein [Pseudobutyrivibrio sp. UC1225]SFO21630.1 hypothetical protein SAMN04487831_11251 [Pseudobutyrivibrio sp. UC1225]